jgi:hypothetical protein
MIPHEVPAPAAEAIAAFLRQTGPA